MLALLLSSCTVHRSFWVEDELDSDADPIKFAKIPSQCDGENFGSYYHKDLRIIEYDDNGDRWERMQVVAAIDAIRQSSPGTPVVVFAHGWRHSANPDSNNNLDDFNNYLKKQNVSPKGMIGIYIGWRGASINEDGPWRPLVAPAMAASLLDRVPAADRVASIPLVHDLWMLRNYATKNRSPLILVGHSLGGRILERAVSESVMAYHVQRENLGSFRSEDQAPVPLNRDLSKLRNLLIADLTILINPASESIYARRFKMALRSWPKNEAPAVISIASETDTAVSKLWPLGMSIDRMLHPLNALPERMFRTGHHLDPKSKNFESYQSYVKTSAGFDPRQVGAFVSLDSSGKYNFNSVSMENWGLHNYGYLVMKCSDNLLSGHGGIPEEGGIFSERMSKFVSYLVRQTDRSKPYSESELYRKLVLNPM